MKICKEQLNELLYNISKDNKRNGLIFKMLYIYGRNIRDILKLRVDDVDLKNDIVDFNVKNDSFSYVLHKDVDDDLRNYILDNEISIKDNDGFLFHNADVTYENEIKQLNYYLSKTINLFNHEVFDFKCPILSTKDFKILRGQHLFLDGADINTILDFYHTSNITVVKNFIGYKDLLKLKFPCDSVDKVFDDFTDLNLFKDALFEGSELVTVYDEDGSDLLVEVDYEDKVLNIVSNGDVEFMDRVEGLHSDELFDELSRIDAGEYKFLFGLKFVKN